MNVIALFRLTTDNAVDDKVLCVPCHDPDWRHVSSLEDLPVRLRDEIAHFLSIYKEPEGHHVKVQGWFPREQGLEVVEASRRRWAAEHHG